jgi:ACS family tartrate transporter-like MFS transporter
MVSMNPEPAPADSIASGALRKAAWRLLPLLFCGYGIAYMDRVNVGFAALRMNQDLHFSATVYGLGGGLFFLSYAICEIPSNLLLVRIGARRWIAQIMIAWGALAAGMMFVRTPAQFYCMRFLLGMAEAGFFPGVLFYLSQWFPREYRGRVVSRFFFAGPISAAVMGAVSGQLLALQGTWGLAGWQWLFLLQGLPAVFLGLVVLKYLRNSPADAPWLTEGERLSIDRRLAEDRAATANVVHGNFRSVIGSPLFRRLALSGLLIYGANYSLNLSAPLLLQSVTHWSATSVGLMMSISFVLGALAMLLNGQHSDRRRERYLHAVWPMLAYAAACLGMAVGQAPALVVLCYAVSVVAQWATQAVFWLVPSDETHGRSAAIGFAAVGTVGMFGAFLGPYAWGLAKDSTGTYQAGLVGLAVAYSIAAAILLSVRRDLRSRRFERDDPQLNSRVRV